MSIKIKQYTKVYSDGTSPVVIQFIKNGKTKYKVLFSIPKADWCAKTSKVLKSNLFWQEYNIQLANVMMDANMAFRKLSAKGENVEFRDLIKTANNGTLEYYLDELLSTKSISESTARRYISIRNKFVKYDGSSPISEISKEWINRYKKYHADLGQASSTTNKEMKLLKAVLDLALEEGEDISKGARKARISFEHKKKEVLNPDELKLVEEIELSGHLDIARDIYLTCFYLSGARIGDVLTMKFSDLRNGYYQDNQGKTKKGMRTKIIDKAKAIFEKYSYRKNEQYIFPLIENCNSPDESRKIESCTFLVNKRLKIIVKKCGINKNITTHTARHTFALMAAKAGVTLISIRDLLGHKKLTTTENYIRELMEQEELDDSMDKVFG